MRAFKNIAFIIIPILTYCCLWFLLYPYFKYNLDADAVGYLTVAERIARGQWQESINGLWSPLNSWILVPFIKMGYQPWHVACYTNFVIGALTLVVIHYFLKRIIASELIRFFIVLTFSIIMVNYVFYQMFGDVLLIFFLLLYALVILSSVTNYTYIKAAITGFIIALAALTKAYSFFFFLFFSIVWGIWMISQGKCSTGGFIKRQLVALTVALVLLLPWSYQLSAKYGETMLLGTAGKLNLSWQINSHKSFKSDIKLLIPPPYSDSPCFWEDPYLSQEGLSTPFSSLKHFLRWVARVGYNTLICIGSFLEMSAFSFLILVTAIYYVRKYISVNNGHGILVLLLLCVTLPLGYLTVHIETRYIWLCSVLLAVIGAWLIERMIQKNLQLFATILLCASFLVSPVLQFEFLFYKNKELFEWSELIKSNNIRGAFTSTAKMEDRFFVVAYLTKNPFYTIEKSDYTLEELSSEMKRYKVPYLFYETAESVSPMIWKDTTSTAKWEYVTTIDDIQVLKLK